MVIGGDGYQNQSRFLYVYNIEGFSKYHIM